MSNSAAFKGVCDSRESAVAILFTGAWIATWPLTPNAEEASIRLNGSTMTTLPAMVMLPPLPCVAVARIWLFCRTTNCGSMLMSPPAVCAPPWTLVMI